MIIQLFSLHSEGFILGQKREKERRRAGGYLLKKIGFVGNYVLTSKNIFVNIIGNYK